MKRGQVWIEVVIYTLIAFVMMGVVLGIARPKIQELQDKAIIEQSILMVNEIDAIIKEIVQGGPGNQRVINLGIKKGTLKIDGVEDKIIFEVEGNYLYSEPGADVVEGNLIISTEKIGKFNKVILTRDYIGEYDITYQMNDELKLIGKSSMPYNMVISNKGGNEIVIDFNIN